MARASCRRPISVLPLRLRITAAAYEDLGVTDAATVTREKLRAEHGIVRTFYDTFTQTDPEPATAHVVAEVRREIDGARRDQTRADLPDVVVKRIRFNDISGAYRAATWWDIDINVIWLLSVKRISDFADEPALYREFGRRHRNNELLPTEAERRVALGDSTLEIGLSSLHRALDEAREYARHGDERWVEATLQDPEGRSFSVGAAYVEIIEEDDGSISEHTLIAVTDLEIADTKHPLAQEARAEFADKYGSPMDIAWEIPAGRARRDCEISFRQTIERSVSHSQ